MTTVNQLVFDLNITANLLQGLLSGQLSQKFRLSPALGTGVGQVNLLVAQTILINTTTPVTVDLTAVPDIGGSTVAFSKLTHFGFFNQSIVVGENLSFFGGTNAALAADPVGAPANGGMILRAAPYDGITIDGTHKNVLMSVAAGAAVAITYVFAGRS